MRSNPVYSHSQLHRDTEPFSLIKRLNETKKASYHGDMTITMNDIKVENVAELAHLIKLGKDIEFLGKDRNEVYAWIETTLTKFRYFWETKKNRGIVKRYLITMTGYSEEQIDKLIWRKKKTGMLFGGARYNKN